MHETIHGPCVHTELESYTHLKHIMRRVEHSGPHLLKTHSFLSQLWLISRVSAIFQKRVKWQAFNMLYQTSSEYGY